MSAAADQERDAEPFEEPHPALWRISVVMTRASGRESHDPANIAAHALDESQLWDAPPGYSLTNHAAAPAPITQVSSRRHTWSDLLLFAAISVAIVARLVLELRSIS